MGIKDYSTDKIIGVGFIVALMLIIVGHFIIALKTGTFPHSDVATNIVSCLGGYMGRSVIEESKDKGTEKKEGKTYEIK